MLPGDIRRYKHSSFPLLSVFGDCVQPEKRNDPSSFPRLPAIGGGKGTRLSDIGGGKGTRLPDIGSGKGTRLPDIGSGKGSRLPDIGGGKKTILPKIVAELSLVASSQEERNLEIKPRLCPTAHTFEKHREQAPGRLHPNKGKRLRGIVDSDLEHTVPHIGGQNSKPLSKQKLQKRRNRVKHGDDFDEEELSSLEKIVDNDRPVIKLDSPRRRHKSHVRESTCNIETPKNQKRIQSCSRSLAKAVQNKSLTDVKNDLRNSKPNPEIQLRKDEEKYFQYRADDNWKQKMDEHREKIAELRNNDDQADLWEELCRLADNVKVKILGKSNSDVKRVDDVSDSHDKEGIDYSCTKIKYLKKNPCAPRLNKADKMKVRHFTKIIKEKVQKKSTEILLERKSDDKNNPLMMHLNSMGNLKTMDENTDETSKKRLSSNKAESKPVDKSKILTKVRKIGISKNSSEGCKDINQRKSQKIMVDKIAYVTSKKSKEQKMLHHYKNEGNRCPERSVKSTKEDTSTGDAISDEKKSVVYPGSEKAFLRSKPPKDKKHSRPEKQISKIAVSAKANIPASERQGLTKSEIPVRDGKAQSKLTVTVPGRHTRQRISASERSTSQRKASSVSTGYTIAKPQASGRPVSGKPTTPLSGRKVSVKPTSPVFDRPVSDKQITPVTVRQASDIFTTPVYERQVSARLAYSESTEEVSYKPSSSASSSLCSAKPAAQDLVRPGSTKPPTPLPARSDSKMLKTAESRTPVQAKPTSPVPGRPAKLKTIMSQRLVSAKTTGRRNIAEPTSAESERLTSVKQTAHMSRRPNSAHPTKAESGRQALSKPITPVPRRLTSAKPTSPMSVRQASSKQTIPVSIRPSSAKSTTPVSRRPATAKPTSLESARQTSATQTTPVSARQTSAKLTTAETGRQASLKLTSPVSRRISSAKSKSPVSARKASSKPSTPESRRPVTAKPITPVSARQTSAKRTSSGVQTSPVSARQTSGKPTTPVSKRPAAAKSTTPVSARQTSGKPTTPVSKRPAAAKSTTPVSARQTSGKPTTPVSKRPAAAKSTTPVSTRQTLGKPTTPMSKRPATAKSTTPVTARQTSAEQALSKPTTPLSRRPVTAKPTNPVSARQTSAKPTAPVSRRPVTAKSTTPLSTRQTSTKPNTALSARSTSAKTTTAESGRPASAKPKISRQRPDPTDKHMFCGKMKAVRTRSVTSVKSSTSSAPATTNTSNASPSTPVSHMTMNSRASTSSSSIASCAHEYDIGDYIYDDDFEYQSGTSLTSLSESYH